MPTETLAHPIPQPSETLAHPLAVTFARDLRHLGPNGFSSWLVEAYRGPVPHHPLRAFLHNEDLEFTDAFALVRRLLPADVIVIARGGVEKAIKDMIENADRIPIHGTYGLSRLVEELSLYRSVRDITSAIEAVAGERLENLNHAVLLRESLEAVLRLLATVLLEMGRTGETPYLAIQKRSSPLWNFEAISMFGERKLLGDKAHALFVPAYAPLFFLSLTYLYVFRSSKSLPFPDEIAERLAILTHNFSKPSPTTKELFVFPSTFASNGKGPYNLDAIRNTWMRFVDDVCGLKPNSVIASIPIGINHIRANFTQFGYQFKTDQESAEYYQEVIRGDIQHSLAIAEPEDAL